MRKILHVDMDAFYAAVEQRDRPELRGRPVVVGGTPEGRGVVATASYEARRFGIRSAMSAARAVRLCPHAVFLRPDFPRYKAASEAIRAIFHRYTDLVEPLSLDEAYLDVTHNKVGESSATRIARAIRAAIHEELQLTASAGVAPNKFLAKIASDVNKPDGLCVVRPERVAEFLATLPVRRLPGVGRVTEARIREAGIEVCSDFLRFEERELVARFGRAGSVFFRLARGQDERPVVTSSPRKSVGIEDTFARDVVTVPEAMAELERLAEGLAHRARRADVVGRTLTLKVKTARFRSMTRSRTLTDPIRDKADILDHVPALLEQTVVGREPVRLLGLALTQLGAPDGPSQLSLPFAAPSEDDEDGRHRAQ